MTEQTADTLRVPQVLHSIAARQRAFERAALAAVSVGCAFSNKQRAPGIKTLVKHAANRATDSRMLTLA
eukprot:2692609-Amphidinium_carterae.1